MNSYLYVLASSIFVLVALVGLYCFAVAEAVAFLQRQKVQKTTTGGLDETAKTKTKRCISLRYEKQNDTTHIYLEGDGTEQQVLRAIVRASFELARPAGLGWLHFNDSQQITDEDADQFITLKPRYQEHSVVEMDYVQGRQCKTYVHRVEEGHFELANHIYERDRGTPDPMFDRAKEILTGKQNIGLASTNYMYKGESLTLRLKEYGFTREPGESDWNFRKRIFPDMYAISADRAMEFLMGGSAAEWDDMDKLLCFSLIGESKTDRYNLVKFAKGFGRDPLETREICKREQMAAFN